MTSQQYLIQLASARRTMVEYIRRLRARGIKVQGDEIICKTQSERAAASEVWDELIQR